MFSRGIAVYGSERILSKASGLSEKIIVFTNQDFVYKIWSSNETFPNASNFFKIYQWNLVYGLGICGQTSESKHCIERKYMRSYRSDKVPRLTKYSFAMVNSAPSNDRGEHFLNSTRETWIIVMMGMFWFL